MRTEGGSPNLINGVSRQPPEVRLTSQLEESVNQFPTVSRGLVPRNPAMLKGQIASALPANALTHMIDRDAAEQYVATIHPSGITVHTLTGTAKTLNAPGGYGYLSGAAEGDLKALTVQDHTFIVNSAKTVAKKADTTPALASEGLVHVVQGDYFTEYKVLVNGTKVGHWTTDGGPYTDSVDARKAERGSKTGVIAYALVNGTPPAGVDTIPAAAVTKMSTSLTEPEWSLTVIDNVIHVKNNYGNAFTLEVEAGSENRIRAHKGTSRVYSELPRKAPDGFVLKIAGDDDTDYDDYYVKFVKDTGSAQGVWRETVGPGLQHRFDPATMPHLLVREADGTFTFAPAGWADRAVGDEDTNPWPSFVGQKIAGMSFGDNRVGFYSGESLSQSRNGDFFNFWVESILSPLDTDPVDASISYPEVSTIYHVVPFAGQSVLFTSSVPFKLGKGETLTQKNIHYEHLIENKVSPRVRPVAAGSKLYFVNDTGTGCFVHEFSYDSSVDNMTAQPITDHVAGYLPTGMSMMEADGDLKMLVMGSDADPNTLYVYKWLWIGNDKAQSAWQKWTFDAPVLALKFYGEELVFVTDRSGTREVLSINCHEAWKQGLLCPVYLDRQKIVAGTYDSNADTTSFTLPYPAADVAAVNLSEDTFGQRPLVVARAGSVIQLGGDLSASTVAFGFEFDSYGVLSPLLHRAKNSQGNYGNAIPGVETTVAMLRFAHGETAYMRVELDRDYRQPFTYEFSAALMGTKTSILGELVVGSINKPVSILSKSGDFRLKFGNIGPYPYSVLSLGWSGDARQVSY